MFHSYGENRAITNRVKLTRTYAANTYLGWVKVGDNKNLVKRCLRHLRSIHKEALTFKNMNKKFDDEWFICKLNEKYRA